MTKALTLDEARERYRWNGTDSTFEGVAVAWFQKQSGKRMVVLEDDRGLLHVYPVSDRLVRQEIAALSDGDRTRADDAQVGPGLGDGEETAIEAIMRSAFGHDWRTDARVLIACQDVTALIDGICLGHDSQMRRVVSSRDATIADLERRLAEANEAPGAVGLAIAVADFGVANLREVDAQLAHARATIADLRAQLDDDVRRLVIAARAVAFGDADEAAIRELDAASEAFADRIPWDDEPAGRSALSQSKEG